MNCQGTFVYRGISHVDAGTFVSSDGKAIAYKGSYKIKVDETTDKGVMERIFKIPDDNTNLIQKFLLLEPYTKVDILFEILISSSNIKLQPQEVDVSS